MNNVLDTIYQYSPAILQNVGVTLYGLKLYRREYGRKLEQLLEQFMRQQWYSEEELGHYQEDRLRELIRHCYDHVPYYRGIMDNRGLKPSDVRTVSDLTRMPILERADVTRHLESLVATNVKHSSLIAGHTSGTTGSPLAIYYDRLVCLAKNAVEWRQKGIAGINLGDPVAYFLGRMVVPVKTIKPPFWRYNGILNHLYCSSFHLSQNNLDAYVDKLRSFAPKAIEGYPSTVYIVASALRARNLTLPVHAVFTSSEPLHPHHREVIQGAFQAEVFDYYGMAERVVFATECEQHSGKHVNTDFGIVEVVGVNSKPAEKGTLGRIVATGLHNWAMPLIRYQTSDVSAWAQESCTCGRGFPLMDNVTTKDEDIVTTPDGRYISSSILTHPFKPLHSVEESQIIQESLSHVRILLVCRESYSDKDTEYLVQELRKRLGGEMKVSIEFVESIARTAAGKYKWVVSKVPLEF